ncbi:hypothetical protein Tco_0960215, partial [Tanacetum coccineum]
ELNMRQHRWLELLSDYDCEIRYHPGKVNVVADEVSDSETNEPPLRSYQLWKKTSYEETHKIDDMTELPKSPPKKTYEDDLESEIVMVKIPRCMAWLGSTDAYDEPIGSLDMIENEVGNISPQDTSQILPSFKEYSLPMTYPKEVEETLGTPIEEEPLNKTQLEDLGLNTYNNEVPLSAREVSIFDEPEPQPQPLPSCLYLGVSLEDKGGPEPPIKLHSPDSLRMKVIFDEEKPRSRKAYLLRDKQISSVAVFDEPEKLNTAKDLRLPEEDCMKIKTVTYSFQAKESIKSNTTAKLPILKLGKYEMWVIRIKQYFQVQDYALWEVIENGNSWVSVPQTSQENGTSVTKMSVPVTVEEMTNKKNDVKARSLLLMALPNKHQLTLLVSRLAILGVVITQEDLNSKFLRSLPPEWNTHVVVWMNKADIKTMSIDDLYNNFKIVEQDVKKSVGTSTGTQNMAFMTAPSTSSTNDVNTANLPYDVSTGSSNVNTASSPISTANISDNVVYAFMVENPNGSNLLQQDLEQIHEDDLEAMDLKECRAPRNKDGQFRYQDNTRKKVNNEDTYSKEMLAIDGVSFDWSDMAEEQCDDLIVKLNQTEFKASTYKRGLATVEEQLVTFRKNEVLFSEEVTVLKREVACKNYEIGVLKTKFEKVKQEKEGIDFKIAKFDNASKSLDKLLGSQIIDNSKGLGYHAIDLPHPLTLNAPTKLDLSYYGLDEFKVPKFQGYGPRDTMLKSTIDCDKKSYNSKENTDESLVKFVEPKNNEKPVRKSVSFDHVQINCPHHQRKRMVTGNNYNRVDYDYYAKTSHPSTHRNMTPRAVLLKSGLTPLNTARPVYTAHPKPTVHSARSMTHFSKQAQSTVQRPFYKKTTLTNRYFNQKVNTVRPRVVNTARPYTTPVNTVREKGVNAVKTSACWVWRPTRPNGASLGKPQMNDKGFVDSGCSRHMTGNIAYLSDFKEFDGGYVTFGGGAYGGRISGKGTLKTDSLDFEDVYFVNELKFNLFSVSQMCDKKNYVLFTDSECLVLSPNFKPPNENQILLKIPNCS